MPRIPQAPATPDEIWTTRDGRNVAVGDMDENHVRNALRMVLRRRREALAAINTLLTLKRTLHEARDHDFELSESELLALTGNLGPEARTSHGR